MQPGPAEATSTIPTWGQLTQLEIYPVPVLGYSFILATLMTAIELLCVGTDGGPVATGAVTRDNISWGHVHEVLVCRWLALGAPPPSLGRTDWSQTNGHPTRRARVSSPRRLLAMSTIL